MGRPTKPIKLHLLEGTGRKKRLAKRAGELQLTAKPLGPAPEWLKAEARAEWERLTTDPEYSQVLSSVHWGALAEYCVLFDRMIADCKGLDEMGSSQRQTLNSLRMQLGITPASQSKVKAPVKETPQNKFAAL